jgi:hypothetical protein
MSTLARKSCPTCGHFNRATAKVCTHCGHRFAVVQADGTARKYCTQCGYPNRVLARVCVQCGHRFRGMRPTTPFVGPKFCPQCGTKRRPMAKVCTHCGYHFRLRPVEPPVNPQAEDPITLPTQYEDVPAPLPPRTKSYDLEGEPAPYISDTELNQLRGAGLYQKNLLGRVVNRLTRKDDA